MNCSRGSKLMDGAYTEMKLIEYGIQNEKSDIRVHVSAATLHAYVFPTKNGAYVIQSKQYNAKIVTSDAGGGDCIVTAKGYAVPIGDIPDCLFIPIPKHLASSHVRQLLAAADTSQRGNWAVSIVKSMILEGLLPISFDILDASKSMQIQGTDIIVSMQTRIQVKFDWAAGPRHLGGSGNIFLQVAESNPFGMH